MTDTYDCNRNCCHSKVFSTENMKLASSASEQNVYFTYVCLVDDLRPAILSTECERYNEKDKNTQVDESDSDEMPPAFSSIQVERTKAVHELVNSLQSEGNQTMEMEPPKQYPTTTSSDESEFDNDDKFISCDNPNILKLTKMKWLTEEHDSSPDSSSPSISPSTSCSSTSSVNSLVKRENVDDKYLSTILRLDKEHNMFGLSSIAIIGSKTSKSSKRNNEERAVFHQTAIVQVCCPKGCCRHMSKSDFPPSLKCSGCKSCCNLQGSGKNSDRGYSKVSKGSSKRERDCTKPTPVPPPKCPPVCAGPCRRRGCIIDTTSTYGLKIKLKRPVGEVKNDGGTILPRSSCILKLPLAMRPCNHTPTCLPPSACFPYLMPCYWPPRREAPCSEPEKCFHKPACPPPRIQQKVPLPRQFICPKHKTSEGQKHDCRNDVCPGNIPSMSKAIKDRFGKP